MKVKTLIFCYFLMCLSVITEAQKLPFSERVSMSVGAGVSELKMTFGTEANQWVPRFSYRLALGYAITERVNAGINFSIVTIAPSNAQYGFTGTTVVISKMETKGERCNMVAFYAKVIPINSMKRLSLQLDAGLGSYQLVSDEDYFAIGPAFGITASYNLLNDPRMRSRIEPYFSYGWANLQDSHVNGELLANRSFQSYSFGVQLFLRK